MRLNSELRGKLSRTATFALVAVAVLSGLSGTWSAMNLGPPGAIQLSDGRVLSINGDRFFIGALQRKETSIDYEGVEHSYFVTEGSAEINMTLAGQKGATFKITKFDMQDYGASDYGGNTNQGFSDSIEGSKKGTLALDPKNGAVKLTLESKFKMKAGTEVVLTGKASLDTADYGYGQVDLADNAATASSSVGGGVVKQAFPHSGKRLRLDGTFDVSSVQPLVLNLTWKTATEGTAIFTSPSFLASKGGKVSKKSNGKIVIEGPSGYGIKIEANPSGSGKVDLGYGPFKVPPGSFKFDS